MEDDERDTNHNLDPANLLPYEKRLLEDDGSAIRLSPYDHNLDTPVIHTSEIESDDEMVY